MSLTKRIFKRAGKELSLVPRGLEFIGDWNTFKKLSKKDGRFRVRWADLYPFLRDKTATTAFDRHYVYHPAWAARLIKKISPEKHIDLSSTVHFCSLLSAFVPTEFYDYRPAPLILDGLQSHSADLLHLPFKDDSISSLSCMHVVEHVGLGRYGDPLDPSGDIKAVLELQRVTAKGGHLFFVVPLASKSRLRFNGHRIYSRDDVLKLFSKEFELRDFSLIPEKEQDGGLISNPSEELLARQTYGCGCFWFTKKSTL